MNIPAYCEAPGEGQPLLLNKRQVCKMLGLATRTLEMKVRQGEFPPPVRLGKCVFWARDCIDTWLKRTFAVQVQWRPE